ncbi:methionyl-tRNA formyltransferase, putative [Ichthyophthirius multifiliis]|uniref:methionyl-tRNA formyltransferase n=1 Tax=Ichthyophthirius multifiliis TaxID=5932 RepID=G0R558_ICHMU|nr:methionyl-tRNA formyltransferase, putative [Ichthyophthirius multifiliis]EGR27382.1 methionyl-tRNA formyltransferase, putative [Ichthyophthirius multifiliis]|eukprot:XP_004024266.1 methionyl-tRNA formyltransferase, putative [Ichthyophthirius multifiliis]
MFQKSKIPIQKFTYNILFFGSDNFPLATFKTIHTKIDPKITSNLHLVTNYQPPEQKSKHKNLIQQYAIQNNLQVYQPLGKTSKNTQIEWQEFIQSGVFENTKFDIGVVCSYGYMIPNEIIDCFQQGMFVIHPSLLPKYRGASPIQQALLNGDKETGVSIIEISKQKFDAGKILKQSKISIPEEFTYTELSEKLSDLSSQCLVNILQNLNFYKQNAVNQNESEVSKAPKFQVQDSFLDYCQFDEVEIYNRFRCFKGTNFVSVRTIFVDKEVILDKISLPNQKQIEQLNQYKNALPGSLWIIQSCRKNFFVKCKNRFVKVDEWRFFNQKIKQAYTFIDQFFDKQLIYDNPDSQGHYFFKYKQKN